MSEDLVVLGIKIDTTDTVRAGKTLEDLVRAAQKVEDQLRKMAPMTGAMNNSFKDTKTSATGAADSMRKLDDELAGLLSRINPAYAGLKNFDSGVNTLSMSLKAGLIGNEQYASSMKLLEAQFAKTAQTTSDSLHLSSTAMRELVVIGRELASGRFSRIPGSISILATSIGLTSTALIGMAAVAIGVVAPLALVGAAAFSASKDFEAMNNAINLTGNFSGLTIGSLRALAGAASQSSQITIGSSKDMATQFAASGKIGADSFALVMMAAAAYSRVSGENASKSAEYITKIYSDPAKEALKLNETMHFLTLAQLDHIKVLQDSGEASKAGAELTKLYLDKLNEFPVTLGLIEKGWIAAKKGASGFWDMLKNIGAEKSLTEQIDAVRKKMQSASPDEMAGLNAQERALLTKNGIDASKAATDAMKAEQNQADQTAYAIASANSKTAKRAELLGNLTQVTNAFNRAAEGSKEAIVLFEGIQDINKQIADLDKVKVIKEKITDYQKLTQEIGRMRAEVDQQIAGDVKLTAAGKKIVDVMADRKTGAQKMTDAEFDSAKAKLQSLDADEKQFAANQKLISVKKSLAAIVAQDKVLANESIEKLTFENSLIGKSVEQQTKLTAAYNAEHEMRKKLALIDKDTLGVHDTAADNAAIAKLQAASDARIKIVKDEAKAKLEATYQANVKNVLQVGANPLFAQVMGEDNIQAEMAKRKAAAEAAHTEAMVNISDLDTIYQKELIESKLKSDIAASDAVYADKERMQAVGRAEREVETQERIATYGKDNKEYAAAALALLDDKYLNEQRGFAINQANAELSRQTLTAEADAAIAKLRVSKDQLDYDNANLTLQTTLAQIASDSVDVDALKNVGLEYQAKWQTQQVERLAQQLVLDKALLDNGKLTTEQLAEQAKLQKQIADIKSGPGAVGDAAKAALIATEAARAAQANVLLSEKVSKEMWSGMLTQMNTDFRNSFLLMLNNGSATWATFIKSLANSFKTQVADFIYKQFLTPIVMKMVLSLAGVVGANGLATAATTAADASKLMGGNVSSTSWMQIGKSLWDGMSNGFTKFGDYLSAGVDKLAAIAYDNGLSSVGSSLTSNSAAIGTAGSYIGAAGAGITIGTFIAGDKSVFGINGLSSSVIGSAIGAAVGGPLGAFIGGIAGGAFNALFGMGPKQTGTTTVAGNYSGAGFAGALNTPWTQEGGLFRSNKSGVDTQALSSDQQNMLNSALLPSVSAFSRLIAVSGEATRSLDGWNFAINRVIANDADMKQLQIDIANNMGAKLLPELVKFQVTGESLADTAVRMGDEYIITDSIFKMMGFTAAATGIASLKMRDSLVALMGGISAANATMDSYYKNFYSADEQQANSLRQVTDSFKVLGLVAPTTRDGFRALAETLVKDTTPAGQALFAAVMKLNPAFASVTRSTEELAAAAITASNSIAGSLDKLRGGNSNSVVQAQIAQDAAMATLHTAAPWITTIDQLKTITLADAKNYSVANQELIANALSAAGALDDLKSAAQSTFDSALSATTTAISAVLTAEIAKAKQAVTDSFATLQRSVTAERDSITKNFTAAVATVNGTIANLTSLSASLKQAVAAIRVPTRAEAQAQILTAIAIAKAGGGLPTSESLAGALQAIAQPSQNLFNTFVDYQRDQILTGNNIANLAAMSDGQLSTAQQTLDTLNSTQTFEMSRLDGILSSAQSQIDVMNGVNTSVLTVAGAVYAMTDAINAYMKMVPGAGMSGIKLPSASVPSTSGLSPMQIGMGVTMQDGSLVFADTAPAAVSSAVSLNAAGVLTDYSAAGTLARRRAAGALGKLPGYASGGDFGGGVRLVGEKGPEIEFTGPSRISSNSESKKLLNNDDVVAIVRELIDTVKAGDIAIATNTSKAAKFIERWEGVGMPVSRIA